MADSKEYYVYNPFYHPETEEKPAEPSVARNTAGFSPETKVRIYKDTQTGKDGITVIVRNPPPDVRYMTYKVLIREQAEWIERHLDEVAADLTEKGFWAREDAGLIMNIDIKRRKK